MPRRPISFLTLRLCSGLALFVRRFRAFESHPQPRHRVVSMILDRLLLPPARSFVGRQDAVIQFLAGACVKTRVHEVERENEAAFLPRVRRPLELVETVEDCLQHRVDFGLLLDRVPYPVENAGGRVNALVMFAIHAGEDSTAR
jgi:hypothetical protein